VGLAQDVTLDVLAGRATAALARQQGLAVNQAESLGAVTLGAVTAPQPPPPVAAGAQGSGGVAAQMTPRPPSSGRAAMGRPLAAGSSSSSSALMEVTTPRPPAASSSASASRKRPATREAEEREHEGEEERGDRFVSVVRKRKSRRGGRERSLSPVTYQFPMPVVPERPPVTSSLPEPPLHNRFETTMASSFSNTPFCTGPVDRIGSFYTPPAVGLSQSELQRRAAEAEANK
jgi:hypothetical protein